MICLTIREGQAHLELPRSPGRCCRLENMDLYCGVAIGVAIMWTITILACVLCVGTARTCVRNIYNLVRAYVNIYIIHIYTRSYLHTGHIRCAFKTVLDHVESCLDDSWWKYSIQQPCMHWRHVMVHESHWSSLQLNVIASTPEASHVKIFQSGTTVQLPTVFGDDDL